MLRREAAKDNGKHGSDCCWQELARSSKKGKRKKGEEGKEKRSRVSVRADRCGVFASSATISDKNQGIPLDVALATTLKSEVLKACNKLPQGFQKV